MLLLEDATSDDDYYDPLLREVKLDELVGIQVKRPTCHWMTMRSF